MPTFNSFENPSSPESPKTVVRETSNVNLFVPKVFGIMFLGLLMTAIIAGLVGFIFTSLIANATEASIDGIISTMVVILLASGIGLIIMSIVIPIVFVRGKHNLIAPFIIFAILEGLLLSSLTFTVPLWILLEAVGITAAVFGSITLIGLLGKGRIPGLGLLMIGLAIGAGFLGLIYLITSLAGVEDSSLALIIDLIVFALIMFISIWDVRKIKTIAYHADANNQNVALYCAFMIYVDFIAIFTRILALIARNKR